MAPEGASNTGGSSGRGGGGNARGKGRAGNRGGGSGGGARRDGRGGGRGGGGGDARISGSSNAGRTTTQTQKAGDASGLSSAEKALGAMEKARQVAAAAAAAADAAQDDEDEEVCFICANPVAHHSISSCNHKTCHICGLRMRALYKSNDCAHCRTSSPFVIFTDDGEKKFEDYKAADFTTIDDNIGIKYAKEDIVGDTVLLLRYNCPDESCDFAGLGWSDLHRHVKTAHKKRMCDLCTRNKKVFTHEHELFTDKELEKHMRRGDDKPGAVDQTGFKGHPLCGFCGERFYDDDKLFEHCRMKHERCFLCDHQNSSQPHYFLNYDELEKHFKTDHFLCPDRGCLEKKFVVFGSELDMQAHQLAEHAGKGVGRDARLVDISSFDIRQPYQEERRGGPSGQDGRSRGRGRGARGRDPNIDDHMLPATISTGPLRRDEIAFQRQMAIHSAPQGSNRTFRGQLSNPAPPSAPATTTPSPAPASSSSASARNAAASRPRSAGPPARAASGPDDALANPMEALSVSNVAALTAEDRARLVRHGSVIERAANLLGNNAHKMAQFRTHVSSFRQGSLTAPQLMEAFFTLFADVSSNALGTLVRELADLFDDKAKADNLRKAWQDWRAINEDYPSLPGPTGAQGSSSSSSSGWITAAASNSSAAQQQQQQQRQSNRVLKLKNSTRLGGPAPNTSRAQPSWVASTSSGSGPSRPPPASAFPSLPSAAKPPATASQPSWLTIEAPSSSSSSGPSSSRARAPPPPPSTRGRGGEEAFPALPAAPKPQTTIFGYGSGRAVRRDFMQAESNFQWGSGPSGAGASSSAAATGPGEEEDTGKGKKGGKKGKKILVQWG
ncbi:LIM domain and RING finger protein [Escovopsis weberi]|uniref:RING-type E3 ubiquitin transferase n=1 Tax=Escovopsis weberi TaxID=150374 RepID=A0A0M8MX99_ESCWE|nr:LIM domain and RING finger protein [Escovopsis weberi]